MLQTNDALQSAGNRHPSVSLIMPAYNLGEKIESSINVSRQVLDGLSLNYEIIVVDDGSRDDTYRRVKDMSDNRIKLIRNPDNMGKGFSFKRGVELATGDYIVLSDADAEIDSFKIASYLKALQHHDLVIASKRLRSSIYNAPAMRKLLSAVFNAVVDIMMGMRFSDTQTGLKAFRSDGIKKIMKFVTVKRYAFDVEILVVAKLLNLKTLEMPVMVNLNKMFRVRNIMYMVIDILGIFYRYRIIRWYQQNLSKVDPDYVPIVRI
jgi:glycosyltransferase involved in cell wall biosynthesis